MDESHDDSLKPKRLKEDDDSSVVNTSQDDATVHMPNCPNKEKPTESGQTYGDQPKKDHDDGDGSKAEFKSEQRKPIHNYNNERNGKPESEKMKDSKENSRESPEIIDKSSGSVQGENDKMGSKQVQRDSVEAASKQSVEFGHWEGGYCDAEVGQLKDTCAVILPQNTTGSYLEAAKTNLSPCDVGPPLPQSTRVRNI